ncbi:MAG: hypothetical protein O6909_13815, partial [Alphaproteobacteria bacterium]|nr:hypothetical protein [Alphaproteobacteria bacterium]
MAAALNESAPVDHHRRPRAVPRYREPCDQNIGSSAIFRQCATILYEGDGSIAVVEHTANEIAAHAGNLTLTWLGIST